MGKEAAQGDGEEKGEHKERATSNVCVKNTSLGRSAISLPWYR